MKARTEVIGKERMRDSMLQRVLLAGGETLNVMKLSYAAGLGLGAFGRVTGQEFAPAILPAIDFLVGGVTPTTERIANYMTYGAGIATAYADKVLPAINELVNRI